MGILDAVLKNPEMLGDIAKFASDNPEVTKAAMEFFSSGNGSGSGLNSLVSSLQSGGLGDAVASWLGSGENASVAPEQLKSALGEDTISQFAEKAGVSGSEASSLLAGMLPQVVDKLSPDGQLPDADGLGNMLGGLLGKLT
jgi:uncharacterized protein YidB (DUF937 family)